MIFIGIKRMYVERGVFLRGAVEIFTKLLLGVLFDVFPAISRSPHDVVDNLILAVVQASDSHAYSVPQEYLGTLPFIPALQGIGAGPCGVSW